MVEMDLRKAMMAGVERVTAWSGLLDRINVFPVADGDTGRNLMISLAPLRRVDGDMQDLARDLLFSARGNAGNIAARFFQAFLRVEDWENLPHAIRQGSDHARQAVADPQPGTMLTFFDGLAHIVNEDRPRTEKAWVDKVMDHMATVVRETTSCQPRLEKAGVVDAGALGMFLFFDGFFTAGLGNGRAFCPVASLFAGRLEVRRDAEETPESGYCVDMVLSPGKDPEKEQAALAGIGGDSMVVIRNGTFMKVHLHTADRSRARQELEKVGEVLNWAEDDLATQTEAFRKPQSKQALHVMTDAAGSLTREQARMLGITLLDSYITMAGRSQPESCLTPDALYGAMRRGVAASTSQASVYERHQSYQSAVSLYGKVLYLCVGSFFTGNYDTARQWQQDHDLTQGLEVIDTGCAAGRLGLLAALTARFAGQTENPDAVVAFAREAIDRCHEFIFVDRLQYLAAGGRLSKASAFFGDMVHMKPIISPQADGARKVGVVRNQRDQVAFALKKLAASLDHDSLSVIWLEYTDNRDWVREALLPQIVKRHPLAEIVVKPMSLTTGVHTGPGSWAVAFFADR